MASKVISELYEKPSSKCVVFYYRKTEQPIQAIEAPSNGDIIIFAIIIVSPQQMSYRHYYNQDWVSWLLKPKLWTLFWSAVCTVLLCHKRLDQLIRPSSQRLPSRCNYYSCELPSCSRSPSASGSLVDIYASFRSNRRQSRAPDRLRNARVVTLEKWGRIFAIKVIGSKDSF